MQKLCILKKYFFKNETKFSAKFILKRPSSYSFTEKEASTRTRGSSESISRGIISVPPQRSPSSKILAASSDPMSQGELVQHLARGSLFPVLLSFFFFLSPPRRNCRRWRGASYRCLRARGGAESAETEFVRSACRVSTVGGEK